MLPDLHAGFWYSHLFKNFPQIIVIHTVKGFGIVNKAEIDFFWNSLAFSMIQWMLTIWSLVPLPFLKPAWTSGNSLTFFFPLKMVVLQFPAFCDDILEKVPPKSWSPTYLKPSLGDENHFLCWLTTTAVKPGLLTTSI